MADAAGAGGRLVQGFGVVLASASPRRRELLERAGIDVEVVPAHVDESHLRGEHPVDYVRRLARAKARAVAPGRPGRAVVAADTAVVLDGEPLGKPAEDPDPVAAAARMLRRLSGRTHQVVTAVHVVSGSGEAGCWESATVTVAELGDDEVARYVATGEPADKAGGYALQGVGAALITRVEGDPTTVVGLPLRPTLALLGAVGSPG